MVAVQEIRFSSLGEVSVADAPEPPAPGPAEVLVAPAAVGVCGSDLHVLHGRHPFVVPPVVTGHEMAGTVLGTGPGVEFPVGSRVLLNPLVPCGRCAACGRGAVNTCEQAKVFGFKLPGAARSRLVVPAAQLRPVPDGVDPDLACLAEQLAAGLHAARRPGDRLEQVLVIGGGPIGLAVLLAARALGAGGITVVEPVSAKRELARSLGADEVRASQEPLPQRHFSTAFDCVSTPDTMVTAVGATTGGGAVVLVGVPSGGAVELPLPRTQRFEIDLLGSGMYLPADLDDALELIRSGRIDPEPLISARFPVAQAPEAFAAAAEPETAKVLIRFR